LIGIVDLAESDLRERTERAQAADVDVEAAFVPRGDLGLDRQAVLVHLPEQIERRFALGEFARDSDIGRGLDDRAFDCIAHIEAVELVGGHDRFRGAAVGDEGIVAGDGDDLSFEQLALLGRLEIQARFKRLGKRCFGGFSTLGHGS